MASIIISVLKKTATRTEMVIDALTIITWTPEIIVSSSQLTVLKAKAFISGPDLIIGVTNMIISAPLFSFRCSFQRGSTTLHLSELGCPAGEGAGTLCAATVYFADARTTTAKPHRGP